MRIKLIIAVSPNDPMRRNDPFMPASLPLLAGSAPEHDYTFVDLLWEDDVRLDEAVDLVGISVRYTAQQRAYEIADAFRARGVKVVLGGPHVSAVPHEAIAHADAVAVGEGETTWPRIVADAAAGQLKSFYICSPVDFDARGRTVHQVRCHPDLARDIPVPLRTPYRQRYVFDTTFASRGCPIGCDFCSVPGFFGPAIRTRPVNEVVKDIAGFKSYYYILDDTVFGRPATWDYYLSLYDEIARLPQGRFRKRFWMGQANLDAAADPKGREVIRRARDAGLLYVAVGMESIDPAVLAASGALRKQGGGDASEVLERMKKNIRFIQDEGIVISGWFVVGYPGDTAETYQRTLDFCLEMNILPVIFPVSAMPGTPLWDKLEATGGLTRGSRFTNVRHAMIQDEDIARGMAEALRRGYSLPAKLRRTLFHAGRFRTDRIHKTIFTAVLQDKIKAGINVVGKGFY